MIKKILAQVFFVGTIIWIIIDANPEPYTQVDNSGNLLKYVVLFGIALIVLAITFGGEEENG